MKTSARLPYEKLFDRLEKPAYSAYGIFLVALLIGVVRLFLEWALGGSYILFPPSDLAMSFGFYWLAIFLFASVFKLVFTQRWRDSAFAAAFMASLGIWPPVIDRLLYAGSFQYGYLWGFPDGYRWHLYNPEAHLLVGEALAWWISVAFAALYAYSKTRSVARAVTAGVLTYGAALVLLAFVPGMAVWVREGFGWPEGHQRTVFVLLEALAAVGVYAVLEPGVARGVLKRLHHALPFVMFCFVGSAFAGAISGSTFAYALFLLLAFGAALGQNDYFDAAEDELQGRKRYLDHEDVRFLTLSVGFIIFALAGVGTVAALPLAVVLALSMLYSYPFYRAKRYFPSNLKMEGMWGLSSFTLGIVAAIEHSAYGAPRWWLAFLPEPADKELLGAFDGLTLAAMILAFAGYSLVAVLKDYKDWEADNATGIQTAYTLAFRRGFSLELLHGRLLAASSLSLFAAPVLLALGELASWSYSLGGAAAAGGLWRLMSGRPSAQSFKATLFLLAFYFLFLALALSFPFPMGGNR